MGRHAAPWQRHSGVLTTVRAKTTHLQHTLKLGDSCSLTIKKTLHLAERAYMFRMILTTSKG
jgi:hypothetical protein